MDRNRVLFVLKQLLRHTTDPLVARAYAKERYQDALIIAASCSEDKDRHQGIFPLIPESHGPKSIENSPLFERAVLSYLLPVCRR